MKAPLQRDCASRVRSAGRPAGALLLLLFMVTSGCGRAPEVQAVRAPERRAGLREVASPIASPEVLGEPEPAEPKPRLANADSEVGHGLDYQNDRIRSVPWSVNLLKIDRSRPDLAFTTSLGHGRELGLGPLTEQLAALPSEVGTPLAAINGDFYRTEQEPYAGDPRGLQIMRGELVSGPIGKTTFWVDSEGNPHLENVSSRFQVRWPDGTALSFGLNEERRSNDAVLYTPRVGSSTHTGAGREFVLARHGPDPWLPLRTGETYTVEVRQVRESGNTRLNDDILVLSIGPTLLARVPLVKAGDLLQLSTRTAPELKDVQVALGGSPLLVHGGKVQSIYTNRAQERHPRSAIGWNETHFFFVEVDGRQHGFSVGMTLPELASYLAKHGCQEAMNLDGGGSSELWIEGQIVNRPCFGYERSTANALVLVHKAELAKH